MKKVLIIMPSMFIGGAERSLLGLLENMDYSEYEVSLFLYRHEGEFMKYIPEQVRILPEMEEYRTFDVPIRDLLTGRQIAYGIMRILGKVALELHVRLSGEKRGVWMSMQYISAFLQPLLPKIPGEYDLAIMYLGIADTLVNKTSASVKLAWNHTDYDILFPDRARDLRIYSKVDAVVSVSEACTRKVSDLYPELASKAITIENCLGRRLIQRQADEPAMGFRAPSGEISLLSIGRFSDAKNFDNVPAICRMIREKNCPVHWYLIGYGAGEGLIREKISENHMEDHVTILGKKANPYPYIRQCDVYVQPSRYEGKCVSVIEAQMLGKPVIITRYATSSSQLQEGIDGMIVPQDNEGCAEGIYRILQDSELLDRLRTNCRKRDYSNAGEVKKLTCWMER